MADITAEDFADTKAPAKQEATPAPKEKDAEKVKTDEERLELTERQIELLIALVDLAEKEDKAVRESILRLCKGYHDYFRGFQDIFWSETAHDWTIPSDNDLDSLGDDSDVLGRYVNIVRAHGEGLISALGVNPPSSRYKPDNADVEADIVTAKACNKLEKKIYKDNDGTFLFYKTLWLLYLEGITFGYNYSDSDSAYGEATVKVSKKAKQTVQNYTCPECGESVSHASEPTVLENQNEVSESESRENNEVLPSQNETDSEDNENESAEENEQEENEQEEPESDIQEAETEPDNSDDSLDKQPETEQENTSGVAPTYCPTCSQQEGNPQVPLEKEGDPFEEFLEIEVDEKIPKTRECLKVYGLLNVKAPMYARQACEMGYLRLAFEENQGLSREKFPDIWDDIVSEGGQNSSLSYERWARNDAQYLGQIPPDLSTTRVYWFRPWYFNNLCKTDSTDYDDVMELKAKYKSGCKVTVFGSDVIAEVCEESMDKHWSVSVEPLNDTLHADPIVKPLIPIQDVKNDVFSLSVDTIEHGIAETFVDSYTLDFDKYKKSRAQPGMKYPVKAQAGRAISDSFYQDKSATLTEEVGAFDSKLDETGQFVIGSFPSIWGGTQSGGSKTLGEYSLSRSQALQRLGIVYNKCSRFFNDINKKAVPSLMKNIKDAGYDERMVETKGTSFINVWIKAEELEGNIGEVEPESSDKLPTSWAQRREIYMQLLQLQNPMIITALTNPQNSPVLRDGLGLDDLYIPGEDDRDKQYAEFLVLLEGEPTQGADGNMVPSLPVQPYDDHEVERATCRAFIVSPEGLAFKKLNQNGFDNIVAHMMMHDQFLAQQTQQASPGSPAGNKPETNARSGVE